MKKGVIVILIIFALLFAGFIAYNSGITGYVVVKAPPSVKRTMTYSKGIWNVRIAVPAVTSYALGVSEQIPPNMNVTKVSAQGVIKENSIEWFFSPAKAVALTYTLKNLSQPVNTTFSGKWYTIEEEGDVSGTQTWVKK
jgi:hypothetical protein